MENALLVAKNNRQGQRAILKFPAPAADRMRMDAFKRIEASRDAVLALEIDRDEWGVDHRRKIAAIVQQELDFLTCESIRYWSKATPKDGERLIPAALLEGFIEAAARVKGRSPRRKG